MQTQPDKLTLYYLTWRVRGARVKWWNKFSKNRLHAQVHSLQNMNKHALICNCQQRYSIRCTSELDSDDDGKDEENLEVVD